MSGKIFKRVKVAPKVANVSKHEADDMLRHFYASNKLAKDRRKPRWQLAQAATSNRRMLIGKSKCFTNPEYNADV